MAKRTPDFCLKDVVTIIPVSRQCCWLLSVVRSTDSQFWVPGHLGN